MNRPRPSSLQLDLPMVLIVALGVALRVTDYLRQTSLNIDESRIALNLGMRSLGGLLPPLDHAQSAPLLFLWTEKLMVGLAGWSELTLRAVPLLAGIATVVLMVPVARRLTTSPTDLFAVALTALAPGLVHFSAVLKQYSLEAMLSVLLLWRLLASGGTSPTSGRAWAILVGHGHCGAVGVGTGCVLRRRRLARPLAGRRPGRRAMEQGVDRGYRVGRVVRAGLHDELSQARPRPVPAALLGLPPSSGSRIWPASATPR